ncbi:hypothetical protein [Sphaerisporangium dianthi]|uniref:Peptidase inhibitor family I36 n=1 Tax=Sphaerisporangium dianthi TaxID=1436120 RepID=A0ABV9CBG6_9ACTN
MLQHVKRIGIGVTASVLLALGGLSGAQANAATDQDVSPMGTCSLGGLLCGVVKNNSASDDLLRITTDWGNYNNSSTWRALSPGQSSKDIGVKDADGFYVWSGCSAYYGGSWYTGPFWKKVYDGDDRNIRLDCY